MENLKIISFKLSIKLFILIKDYGYGIFKYICVCEENRERQMVNKKLKI